MISNMDGLNNAPDSVIDFPLLTSLNNCSSTEMIKRSPCTCPACEHDFQEDHTKCAHRESLSLTKATLWLGLLLILAVTRSLTSPQEAAATAPVGMLHPRQKRATCDLVLSLWNVKSTACAAHCLARRYKGGYCNNKAICVCRR